MSKNYFFAIKNCNSKIPENFDFQKEDKDILDNYTLNLNNIRSKIDELDVNLH